MHIYLDIAIYFIHVGPLTYKRKSKSWCTPKLYKTRYESYAEAKGTCSKDDDCAMFYDYRGRGYYYLCGYPTTTKPSSKGSILYSKMQGAPNYDCNFIELSRLHIETG